MALHVERAKLVYSQKLLDKETLQCISFGLLVGLAEGMRGGADGSGEQAGLSSRGHLRPHPIQISVPTPFRYNRYRGTSIFPCLLQR